MSAPSGSLSAQSGLTHGSLSRYTVHVHCHCALSMYTVNAVTIYCHCTWYTVFWHCTLSLHTSHRHCTKSLYTVTVHCHCTLYNVTVHCTLWTVLCTLYSPRSHRMYPHTQYVPHNAQDSILALYTVTLHSLYSLTVHCHCTLSLYTVIVNLVRVFWEGVDGNLSSPLCNPLTPPPPPQLQPQPKEQLQPQ